MRNSPSTVADMMTPAPQAIHGLTTVAAAIDLIRPLGVPRLPDGDPRPGLPWAASLRNWAMGALGRGEEVVILFVDLDNFGIVNKALGHVVGDDILRSVGYLLSASLDPSTDFICRYGGDEFAIATTRRVEDATA